MVVLAAGVMASNAAMGASFFSQTTTPSPAPSAIAPTPAPSAIAPTPAHSAEGENTASVAPTPAVVHGPPPPVATAPEPVHHLLDIPEADWQSLGPFIAQKQGVQALSRDFLSDWAALTDCKEWQRVKTDEFAMEDLRSKARASLASAPAVHRVRIKLNTTLGEYDFTRQGFPLEPITSTTVFRIPMRSQCPWLYFGHSNEGFPGFITIAVARDASWYPGLPLAHEQAHAVVEEMRGNRNVSAELVVDLQNISASPYGGVTLSADPVAMFIWRDPKETRFIGAVGQVDPGAELARPLQSSGAMASPIAVATPASKPLVRPSLAAFNTPAPTEPTPATQTAPAANIKGFVTEVLNEATLLVGGRTVHLASIEPSGSATLTRQFTRWLRSQGPYVTCEPRDHGYRCLTSNGVDVAQAAIMNGAGRPAAGAPPDYFVAQNKAETHRRGMWAK